MAFGEALDFRRLTAVEIDRRYELRAEMRLPGVAKLCFEVMPDFRNQHRSTFAQTGRFKPRGLLGLAYWYAVLLLHGPDFSGMPAGGRRFAEQTARSGGE